MDSFDYLKNVWLGHQIFNDFQLKLFSAGMLSVKEF